MVRRTNRKMSNDMARDKKHTAELIKARQRRLEKLEIRAALMGINTPPEVTIEIEDLKETIARLQAQLRGDTEIQTHGKRPPASKPQPVLHKEFSYADSSLADADFPTVSGDPVSEIILALRSYVFGTQNSAIKKIFSSLNWPERTPDDAFVIGRNIYQCADGNEFRARDIMNNLRRELAKIPGDWGLHIVNGMFYEAYFDCEGKFREGNLKDKYLSKLFEVETIGKFADC